MKARREATWAAYDGPFKFKVSTGAEREGKGGHAGRGLGGARVQERCVVRRAADDRPLDLTQGRAAKYGSCLLTAPFVTKRTERASNPTLPHAHIGMGRVAGSFALRLRIMPLYAGIRHAPVVPRRPRPYLPYYLPLLLRVLVLSPPF